MSITHHTAGSALCVNHIFHNNEMYIIIHILYCNYELCYGAQIEDNSRLSSHLALAYHTKNGKSMKFHHHPKRLVIFYRIQAL